MEQPPSCSCFTVIFTVLQEAVLVLAVNPAAERIKSSGRVARLYRHAGTFWHVPNLQSLFLFFWNDPNVNSNDHPGRTTSLASTKIIKKKTPHAVKTHWEIQLDLLQVQWKKLAVALALLLTFNEEIVGELCPLDKTNKLNNEIH